jgi:hypothetical protein
LVRPSAKALKIEAVNAVARLPARLKVVRAGIPLG